MKQQHSESTSWPGRQGGQASGSQRPSCRELLLWPEGQAFYTPQWEALRYLMLTSGASQAAHSTQ